MHAGAAVAVPRGKLQLRLLREDVRVFMMMVVMIAMMMIKRRINLLPMLHSWPAQRPLLNDGCLSAQPQAEEY